MLLLVRSFPAMGSAELMKAEDLEWGNGGGQYITSWGLPPNVYPFRDWTVPAHWCVEKTRVKKYSVALLANTEVVSHQVKGWGEDPSGLMAEDLVEYKMVAHLFHHSQNTKELLFSCKMSGSWISQVLVMWVLDTFRLVADQVCKLWKRELHSQSLSEGKSQLRLFVLLVIKNSGEERMLLVLLQNMTRTFQSSSHLILLVADGDKI